MDTLTQPPVKTPAPQAATPYFLRRAIFAETVEGIARWYRGGLPPEPSAA